ncbi:transforming acidic coiled-coil-containing protein 3 isoform X2 [Hemicordylus capensis]|uniref:transforming acidic coiled-coil-containing protein 3 isoform X2 n=1 Tax=Hemicordylus capensis TaxID=884348 RepID=UPI002302B9B9|nr:transforming acidic coiled-coil-containing protein 3 isoform X2 [Hemicordylus capensis]
MSFLQGSPLGDRAQKRMSLQPLTEENISNDIAGESFTLLLVTPEATGRISPLQKENMPPKGIMKPRKVTFQTPSCDSSKRRSLSPDIRKKPEIASIEDNCVEVPVDLVLPASNAVEAETEQTVSENQAVAKAETEAESLVELMIHQSVSSLEASNQDILSLNGQSLVDNLLDGPSCRKTETTVNESNCIMDKENVEFRSPLEVLGNGIEVDYLEQFGTAPFDPLLSESPKSLGPDACESIPAAREILQNGLSTEIATVEEKPLGLDLLGTFPDVSNSFPDLPTSDDTSLFSCTPLTEAIIEVLKYSQKDMDEAVEKVKQEMDVVVKKLTSEVQEKQNEVLEWKRKHDNCYIESQEMRKIVAEFESTITQMMKDSEDQKELSKKELQKVMDEKQQVMSDLSSMEKSFSELFKRFEKQKEAIEGFQRNEEALKKCVEDYFERIKKEEQRYQALKAHAEEKLSQANEEIAQVRSKAKAEVAALQASLRKEQMRIQSLERSIEQKEKENYELTKICDDLISKMEKMT